MTYTDKKIVELFSSGLSIEDLTRFIYNDSRTNVKSKQETITKKEARELVERAVLRDIVQKQNGGKTDENI